MSHPRKLPANSSLALIAYDYLLTFKREVELVWGHRINASSSLFFANRYLAVFYNVSMVYYRTLLRPYPVSPLP